MAQTTTVILLPQTAHTGESPIEIVGDRFPAAAYYLGNQDLQTLSYSVTEASGDIMIQATLATVPSEQDWFDVHELSFSEESETSFYNITGNFVYIRAVVYDFSRGIINYVKLSY